MTLTLRARLAVIATTVSGVLLGGLSTISYNVLARWLDDDVRTRLTEIADGLHGYLRFEGDVPMDQPAGKVVQSLSGAAQYLEERDPKSAIQDLDRAIQAHPYRAIAVCLGLGWMIGRMARR